MLLFLLFYFFISLFLLVLLFLFFNILFPGVHYCYFYYFCSSIFIFHLIIAAIIVSVHRYSFPTYHYCYYYFNSSIFFSLTFLKIFCIFFQMFANFFYSDWLQFRMPCHLCFQEFVIRTDPQNRDYLIVRSFYFIVGGFPL